MRRNAEKQDRNRKTRDRSHLRYMNLRKKYKNAINVIEIEGAISYIDQN